jgi:hypothetical protein
VSVLGRQTKATLYSMLLILARLHLKSDVGYAVGVGATEIVCS